MTFSLLYIVYLCSSPHDRILNLASLTAFQLIVYSWRENTSQLNPNRERGPKMLSMRSDNLRFSSWVDSGLLVVVTIIISMVVSVFFVLFYVQYEWCPVLFRNFTVLIPLFYLRWPAPLFPGEPGLHEEWLPGEYYPPWGGRIDRVLHLELQLWGAPVAQTINWCTELLILCLHYAREPSYQQRLPTFGWVIVQMLIFFSFYKIGKLFKSCMHF